MFKKTLLFVALSSFAGSALSAPPVVNLKVSGTITPPTCTVNGQETTPDISYKFDVSPGVFPASGNLTMTGQSQNIKVACDATTYLAFSVADQRDASLLTTGPNNFGLGTYGAGDKSVKVGYYQVTMQNAKTTAKTGGTETEVGVQVGTVYGTAGKLDKTLTTSWATAKDTPAAAQAFSADLVVTPTLNGALKNSDGSAKLDGHAILTFSFGV